MSTGEYFSCLMHPEVKSDKPGKCPKCGMQLARKSVGAQIIGQTTYVCPMHAEIKSDKPGKCPKCGMTLVALAGQGGVALTLEEKQKVPGYPQDMMMSMDDDVAKPETYGLPAGWTASMMGMMTLVRVLPEDKYNQVIALVEKARTEKTKAATDHQHHNED